MPERTVPNGVGQQQFEARCAALIAASAGMARGWTTQQVTRQAEQFEDWLLRPAPRVPERDR